MIAATVANAASEKAIPFSEFYPDWEEAAHGDDP
jgi:hypothetical protein